MRKKLFTLLLAMMTCLGSLFAESGTCGANLTWDLTDGVLTISGTGPMTNYKYYETHWPRESVKVAIIDDGVTTIGDCAFYNCKNITSVIIGDDVNRIGSSAFEYCEKISSITFGKKLKSIDSHNFYYCDNIQKIIIKDLSAWCQIDFDYLGGNPLEYAKSPHLYLNEEEIIELVIPDDIQKLNADVFLNCSNITKITIPNSITYIYSYDNKPFHGCSSLKNIVWNANNYNEKYGSPFEEIKEQITSFVFGENIETISNRICYGMANLTEINIPNSVTTIGESAFAGTGISSISIPQNVISIGENIFSNCKKLEHIDVSSNNKVFDSRENCNAIISSIENKLVIGIRSTTIPQSVTSIGDGAFSGCSSLTSFTIPNSVTSIGDGAFSGCSSLTSFTIPNSVTSIGDGAFSDCSSLISIEIPTSITSIGKYTFYSCYSLTSVTIPNSVTSIGERAFSGCMRIKKFIIPNSVTTIGRGLFYAGNLDTLIIGKNVQSIGEDAFAQYIPDITYQYRSGAPIKFVKILAPQPPSMSYTGERPNSEAKFGRFNVVYVPYGSLDTYRNNERWKRYHLHTEGLSEIGKTLAPTSFSLIFGSESAKEHIVSCGIEEGEEFPGNIVEYNGLEPNGTYNEIPFFIKTNEGDYDTLHVSFTTTALELTTKTSKPVSSTTAILLAETNMSDAEVNCGFEYKRNDAPADMDGTKVFCPVASGQMAGRLKGLKDDVYYKYRAFYQSTAGNTYYGDWQYIFTGDVAVEFDPILYTYGATVVRENEAAISGYALAGSEDFTEQGFEYWSESRANGGASAPHRMIAALGEHKNVQASGISLRVTLTDLDAGTVYKYRVYGKVGDQYYYGAKQTFTTTGTYVPPTYMITFANWDGTELQKSPVAENELPVYSGETPVRPEDEHYTYSFTGWTPSIVIATADATYTATYKAEQKSQGIEDVLSNDVPCTKIVHNGQIFILRGEKVYNAQGALVK